MKKSVCKVFGRSNRSRWFNPLKVLREQLDGPDRLRVFSSSRHAHRGKRFFYDPPSLPSSTRHLFQAKYTKCRLWSAAKLHRCGSTRVAWTRRSLQRHVPFTTGMRRAPSRRTQLSAAHLLAYLTQHVTQNAARKNVLFDSNATAFEKRRNAHVFNRV